MILWARTIKLTVSVICSIEPDLVFELAFGQAVGDMMTIHPEYVDR